MEYRSESKSEKSAVWMLLRRKVRLAASKPYVSAVPSEGEYPAWLQSVECAVVSLPARGLRTERRLWW